MLTRRVIPCLDVRDGSVVKGTRFRDLRRAGDPVELAVRYEADGADELVVLDVSATRDGRAAAAETVRAIRRVLAIPLTVGGGVRTVDDARALLDAGADKVALNTAAYEKPALIDELAGRFGSQCVTVSVDAARISAAWRVVIRAGTQPTVTGAIEWSAEAVRHGAGEILLTSIDRDGTQSGYDIALIVAVARSVGVPVVASGGARVSAHLAEALRAGADAVLAASILHDAQTTVRDLKRDLAREGFEVRP